MIKKYANNKNKYKTRSSLKAPAMATDLSGKVNDRSDFVLDSAGYFVWPKSKLPASRTKKS